MKRLANALVISAFVCIFALSIWWESVREFSTVLHLLMLIVSAIGVALASFLSGSHNEHTVANGEVPQHRKNGISD